MHYHELAGSLLFLAWGICWYFLFFTHNQRGRAAKAPVKNTQIVSASFACSTYATFALIALWSLSMWWGLDTRYDLPPEYPAAKIIIALGVLAVLAGQVLLVSSRRSLSFLTNMQLLFTLSPMRVEKALYRYIKHPMYAGLYLALCGSSVVLLNGAAAVIAAVLIGPMLIIRARLERGRA